jgi:hypothetical protein
MPFINSRVADEPEKDEYFIGFPKGLNTIQDKTLVDNKNLTLADNAMIVVDGITRRYGTYKMFDEASATKVFGSAMYYNRATSTRKWIRAAAARIQYLSGTAWTNVAATAYTNTRTRFVQANNKLFIHNGTDALSYYNGSTLTSYTAINNPGAPTVTPTYAVIQNVTSITRSSNTATVTTTAAHGYSTGDYVTIAGATQSDYNGIYQITVLSTTTFTYTVANTPVTPATGTITASYGGATSYSYKIVAFNGTGQTAAGSAGTTATGPATLSSSNYNKLTWSAVTNATGYYIYGRKSTGFGECYLATVYTNSYNDTGDDTPTTTLQPPADNTTGGIKAKGAIFTLGRQFCFGVTEGTTYYPTRLYYSGTVNNIDNFTSGEYGGGWVEIAANDGGEIVDIKPFQNGVLVWKTNGIFKFQFNVSSGYPQLQDITRSHGGVNFEASQNIDNDYVYVGQKENRIFIASVGTQAQYGTDELRTNEISIFIENSLTGVNRNYLSNICSFYYDNKFGFTYTTGDNTENSTGFVLDIRVGGWMKWYEDPMECTHYTVYDDGTDAKLYGGSNSDGYMIELMRNDRSDTGNAFRTAIGTKFVNNGKYDVEKIWRNPTFWFKYINGGAISLELWVDGINYVGSTSLSSGTGGAGAGGDLAGSFLAGSNYSDTEIQNPSSDIVKELQLVYLSKSIGFYLIDESANTNWLFQGFHLISSDLDGKPVSSTERVSLNG